MQHPSGPEGRAGPAASQKTAAQDLRESACVSRTTARAARQAPAGGPAQGKKGGAANEPPGGHGGRAPPDPIPTSEVKPPRADDSVDPHAKVGHCQAPKPKKPPALKTRGAFFDGMFLNTAILILAKTLLPLGGLGATAIKLRKSTSFRQGMPEPRSHGGQARFTSLCSGYRQSMPV